MLGQQNSASASAPPRYFPRPELTDAAGLVGIGGELNTEWLLDAYTHGIFPWPLSDGLLAWWSPDPRAIFEFDQFRPSRRLLRRVRSGQFEIAYNRDFAGVLHGCATAQQRDGHTWLTAEMQTAYLRLHRQGIAHCVEAWQGGELVGGVYGVGIGAYFAAESMFYRARDASKVALVTLLRRLAERGYQLVDIQQLTSHTSRLGATEISRAIFFERLLAAQQAPASFLPIE